MKKLEVRNLDAHVPLKIGENMDTSKSRDVNGIYVQKTKLHFYQCIRVFDGEQFSHDKETV
jgi:hypothetical protein